MEYFDLSVEGFWDSFFGAVLAAPIAIYWLVIGFPESTASTGWVIAVEVVPVKLPVEYTVSPARVTQ